MVLVSCFNQLRQEGASQDGMLDAVVDTIQKHANTGNKEDGKIFIYDVKNAIRMLTGERGDSAV